MTKRKYKRPASPEEIAERKRQDAANAAEVERLRALPDVAVTVGPRGEVLAARRADVFDLFLARRRITEQQHKAVRRLEAEMAAGEGADGGSDLAMGRVDCGAGGGAIDRRMVAQDWVAQVIAQMPRRSWTLLCGLLSPQFGGQIADWRAIVVLATGETDAECQGLALRWACQDLEAAYLKIDKARPSGRKSPTGMPAFHAIASEN